MKTTVLLGLLFVLVLGGGYFMSTRSGFTSEAQREAQEENEDDRDEDDRSGKGGDSSGKGSREERI
jgi:hypothetical protein